MWSALQSAMQDDGTRRRVDRGTWRRVAEFARPHRRTIVAFLSLATLAALLGVLAPVLAGRAVDAIVDGRRRQRRDRSGRPPRRRRRRRHRRRSARTAGVVPARRAPHPRPASPGVRPRAVDADRLLHPHPHGGPRQPVEQRRHRRPTGVHVRPLRGCHERHHPRADAGSDAQPVVADHGPGRRPAAVVRDPCPPRRLARRPARARGVGAQRGDDIADDRALLRPGRDARQAVRAPARRGRRVRGPGGAGQRHRDPLGDGDGGVLPLADPRVRSRSGAGLRPRRLPRRPGPPRPGHGGHDGPAAQPAVRAVDGARARRASTW